MRIETKIVAAAVIIPAAIMGSYYLIPWGPPTPAEVPAANEIIVGNAKPQAPQGVHQSTSISGTTTTITSTMAPVVAAGRCVQTAAGYLCSTSPGASITLPVSSSAQATDEDIYAVGALLPDAARFDPGARAAAFSWAMSLPGSRARSAYLSLLASYDEAARQQADVRSREEAAQKLAAEAPRASCRQGDDKRWSCETAEAAEHP